MFSNYQYIPIYLFEAYNILVYQFHVPGIKFTDPSQFEQFLHKDFETGKWQCMICKDFSHKTPSCVRNHVESKHLPNTFSYNCPYCGKTFGTNQAFMKHKNRDHKE